MVVSESSINNIMGGLESTGGVTLHNHRRKLKQRFETIAKLGQGTYGKVQLGINKETGQEVAIKTIKKSKIETEADLIRIRREIQIMSSLRHPYIIHIYEVFENRDKMVLVMEYAAGGELYDFLSKKKVLDEQEARRIFRQIAMAVYYCHKHQICHRDLKLENILLDEQGNAKIADFGLSNVFDKSRLLSTFCGSPLYASPEIVKGIPYNGPEVDCWSMGVLLYTLVYGAMPFDGSNFKRLVRQISAGEYYEPKTPSSASLLIAGLLTVKGTERLNITQVCQHPWMSEEGKVSCYRLAVELAEQEPNRLDLLLALAPQENQIPGVPEEVPSQETSDRPARSMSLSSLPVMQPSFTAPIPPTPSPQTPSPLTPSSNSEEPEASKSPGKEKKRERSSSRTRKKDSDEDKSKKKSVKTKKKSDTELSKEEMEEVLQEARKLSEIIAQTPAVPTPVEEKKDLDFKLPDQPKTAEEATPKAEGEQKEKKDVKKIKKVKSDKETSKKDEKKELSPTKLKPKTELKLDLPVKDSLEKKEKPAEDKIKTPEEKSEVPLASPKEPERSSVPEPQLEGDGTPKEEAAESKEAAAPPRRDSIRRKSRVFETAEMFNKTASQDKIQPKKVFLPGVKVSDAKAAFERRSSIPQETKPEFSLASTVNVNKLVQSELGIEAPEVKDNEKTRKENAVKVISHAISESGMNKASTLPRRKLSKPMIPRFDPTSMIPNTSVSEIMHPTPATPPVPVPPPRPSLTKQDSGPREHIIPIQIEKREDKPPPVSKQTSVQSSRASSVSSIGRQDSENSSTTTIGTPTLSGSCEPIRKSPREVIIPIAVEGGGYVTPSASTLSKMSSMSEGEDEGTSGPVRGFGLHSTRRKVEHTDSLSSDEEDDNFEMLTAENLFSSLLSRVRNLTYRLNENEGRPNFPRLFNHSIFDAPSRRLTETKSFSSEQDPTPWRRKRETTPSSTLPRGFSARAFRRTLTGGDEGRREGRPPPAAASSASLRNRRHSEDEVVEDFLATGKLSSLDRVRSYLEGLRRANAEAAHVPLRRYFSSDPQKPTDIRTLPRSKFSTPDGDLRPQRPVGIDADFFGGQKKTSQTQIDNLYINQNGKHDKATSDHCNGYVDDINLKRAERNERLQRRVDMLLNRSHENNVDKGLSRFQSLHRPQKVNRSTSIDDNIVQKTEKVKRSVTSVGEKSLQKAEKYRKPEKNDQDLQLAAEIPSTSNKSEAFSTSNIIDAIVKEQENTQKLTKPDIKENGTLLDQIESGGASSSTSPQNENKDKKAKSEKKEKKGSRVNKAINALKKKSETYENEFTESKLLKRAVSLEDLNFEETPRATRASSLKPEGVFKKKESPKTKKGGVFESLSKKKDDREARINNLKRLDLVKMESSVSTESTPTGDQDERESMVTATDNSDTWSSCDLSERLLDPSTEELSVLERIRRKSFYHRFNMPKKNSYQRSMSNMERKRYY